MLRLLLLSLWALALSVSGVEAKLWKNSDGGFTAGGVIEVDGSAVSFASSFGLPVNCISGCSASANPSFGAAFPATGLAVGAESSGNLTARIACDNTAFYDASTLGSTQLVALVSTKKIYVCGYSFFSGGTTNVKLQYGTGTACATGTTQMTPAYQLTTQTGIVDGAAEYRGLSVPASNALCINSSAAVAVQALVYWTQF